MFGFCGDLLEFAYVIEELVIEFFRKDVQKLVPSFNVSQIIFKIILEKNLKRKFTRIHRGFVENLTWFREIFHLVFAFIEKRDVFQPLFQNCYETLIIHISENKFLEKNSMKLWILFVYIGWNLGIVFWKISLGSFKIEGQLNRKVVKDVVGFGNLELFLAFCSFGKDLLEVFLRGIDVLEDFFKRSWFFLRHIRKWNRNRNILN